LRGLRDSRADVDGDSAHLAFDHLALTGVQAGTDLQTQLFHRLGDRAGAADRSSRPVEAGEEPVTGRIELPSVIADELSTDDRVVPLEELAPCPVAELHRLLRRADDVGEEDGGKHAVRLDDVPLAPLPDAGQEALDLACDLLRVDEVRVVVAGQFDELRAGGPVRDVARLVGVIPVSGAAKDERGNANRRQRMTRVNLHVHAPERDCGARADARQD
jgi:hypothetical protein